MEAMEASAHNGQIAAKKCIFMSKKNRKSCCTREIPNTIYAGVSKLTRTSSPTKADSVEFNAEFVEIKADGAQPQTNKSFHTPPLTPNLLFLLNRQKILSLQHEKRMTL